jgi:hypothetical protein
LVAEPALLESPTIGIFAVPASMCFRQLLLKLLNVVVTSDLTWLTAETVERIVAGSRRIAGGCG